MNEGGQFKTEDVWDSLKPLLKKEVIEKIEQRTVTHTIAGDYMVRFLGARSLDRLAEVIDEYSSKLNIVGNLAKAIALDMADGSKAYLSYLAFDHDSANVIDELLEQGAPGLISEGGPIL